MSKFIIQHIDRENETDYNKWLNFLSKANGKTLFHHPDFLSYHGNRFNEHHLGFFKGQELYGIIPLAIIEENGIKVAKSPYGASYGGFIFQSILNYTQSKEIVTLFLEYLNGLDINRIFITSSLPIYHNKGYSSTFIFSLLERGFRVTNSEITAVVTLDRDMEHRFNSRVKRNYKKAEKFNLEIQYNAPLDDFWRLMDITFSRHGVKPTHTKDEYQRLMELLPNKVYANIVYFEGKPVFGIGEMSLNSKNYISFYICGDDKYRYLEAQTYLIVNILKRHFSNGVKYYDFGTCSTNMVGGANIFSFKEGFGADGVFRDSLSMEI